MKARSSLALIPARFIFVSTLLFVTCLSEVVDAQSWQEASSDLFTNISIVWRTDTSQLANSVWIYRRLLPHIFPTAVVSNAVVLGSLQSRGFPQSSTNNVFISEQMPPNWPGMIPVLLGIQPGDAYLYFSIAHCSPISQKDIPDDSTLIKRALEVAPQFGLDPMPYRNWRWD